MKRKRPKFRAGQSVVTNGRRGIVMHAEPYLGESGYFVDYPRNGTGPSFRWMPENALVDAKRPIQHTTLLSADHSAALDEVETKSEAEIEIETAKKWAARASACHQKWKETGDTGWLLRAEHYRQEAVEHAALAGDGGRTLLVIERSIPRLTAKGRYRLSR